MPEPAPVTIATFPTVVMASSSTLAVRGPPPRSAVPAPPARPRRWSPGRCRGRSSTPAGCSPAASRPVTVATTTAASGNRSRSVVWNTWYSSPGAEHPERVAEPQHRHRERVRLARPAAPPAGRPAGSSARPAPGTRAARPASSAARAVSSSACHLASSCARLLQRRQVGPVRQSTTNRRTCHRGLLGAARPRRAGGAPTCPRSPRRRPARRTRTASPAAAAPPARTGPRTRAAGRCGRPPPGRRRTPRAARGRRTPLAGTGTGRPCAARPPRASPRRSPG